MTFDWLRLAHLVSKSLSSAAGAYGVISIVLGQAIVKAGAMCNSAGWLSITQGAVRIWRLAISLAMMLLLSPLANLAVAQQSTPQVTTYTGGVYTMLSCTSGQCRQADRQDIFAFEPDTALRLKLGFVQSYPEAKEFRVFLLLNYQQTQFAVRQDMGRITTDLAPLGTPIAMPDAGEMQPVLDFTAPPERELHFDIWTEPLAAGYYDLALLVVPDLHKTQRELPYWTVYRLISRASVYVGGSATPPTLEFPLVDPAPHEDSGFAEWFNFGRGPYNMRLYGEKVVQAGEDVTLPMNFQPFSWSEAGEPVAKTPVPTAFIAVIDDRVVPLNGQPVVYGSALPYSLSSFPVTVTAPADLGIHQLFVQQFPNPYVDVAEADNAELNLFGESSQRLILDAR